MTDIVAELIKFTKPPAGTIRFFKKGGQFYAIDEDAEVIASRYLRSIGSLKEAQCGHHYVSVSEVLYISLLRDLLLYDRKSIELMEFDTNKWSKAYEASPGNISSVIDLINNDLDISKSTMLLAVAGNDNSDQLAMNAACCDSTLFTIATTEFVDTSSLVHFENLLTQTMPSEIIFCDISKTLFPQLEVIAQRFGIPYHETKPKNPEVGTFPNTKSVKALISSLSINIAEFKHKTFSLYDFMTIDYAASRAMNVFPDGQSATRGLPTSLYQLLNECVTPMGARLLQQYMQQPLLDKDKIEMRLNIVESLLNHPDVMISVKDAMKQIPDIARLTRKFLNGRATILDCVRLRDVAAITPQIAQIKNAQCESLSEFAEQLDDLESEASKVRELVEKTVDFDVLPQHIYRVTPEFDEGLTETSEKMKKVKAKMEALRSNLADETGVDNDKMKLERMPNQRVFFFRVGRALEKSIRNISEIHVTESRKDGVHFTTKSLKKLVDTYFDLEDTYSNQQREIAQKLYETLKGFAPMFQILNDVFAQIDVYISLASVASTSNFVKPTLSQNDSEILLTQARHPLVEKHCSFIPNTVDMKRGESSFIIISGPNSAGKSTLLKTVGICIYLAHIGSFVPCDEAIIPITTSIHARVGAWDSANMSTFTIEMTEMSGILQSARKNSFIMVDELGRSTSCSDGFGLAWAISKKLAKDIGSFTMFATHFHELCNLENEIECVANFHMDASTSSMNSGLLMTYQFLPGAFPTSFGIDAAERAGFPKEVMERAIVKEAELELADKEEGDKPKRVIIDPNEPYRNFLRKLLTIDTDEQSAKQVTSIINDALKSFDEETKNRKMISAD
ncbi:DNA mismatch repair protein Msh2 [Tritrichomonas foetus]|uniref:DNA mismatch repair protein Msh2 n=1 Tax=Tritrichomonas foetus TaxID=1144522 RepID=A0A1J4KCQ7_9EUKA|nr:DNA mismatch repair protein Msh2 [Tritrichomonas foetus]|eukprot:OHT07430.1 DNA mismatch repair protein Msh2 [Tritrichomonas foetus]